MSQNWTVFVFALACVLQATMAEDIGCFVDGECTHSPYVEGWPSADAQECLEICRDFDGCEYFTYYGLDEDYCVGFYACVEFNSTSCDECYSGNSTCPDLQCWVKGSCTGAFISVDHVSNDSECLEACQNDKSCNWFTYDDTDGACSLFEGCVDVSTDDCGTCWSGQRQCGERKDYTKILIVGGYNDDTGEFYDSVEVVDLTLEVQSCLSPSNYPLPISYMVGTMIDAIPTICGGYNADIVTDECYQYDHIGNRWTPTEEHMLQPRKGIRASMVDSITWMISGGFNDDVTALDSTEVYQDGHFSYGPTLPSVNKYHCQITVNSTHIALLGGQNNTDYLYDFYLLDWENQDWISMPDSPTIISSDSCGMIENSVNGQELVVLVNHVDCQIFSFEDQTWRPGPILTDGPNIIWESMVAQMRKNFYILGGRLADNPNSNVTDVVFEFDAENYEWVRQSFTLSTPRRGGVAIPVPDNVVQCP